MGSLSEGEVQRELSRVPGWRLEAGENSSLVRDWTFADFPAALAFVDRVGDAAETAGHHPDILLHGWNKVRLTLFTHSQGGLTEADFALAADLSELA